MAYYLVSARPRADLLPELAMQRATRAFDLPPLFPTLAERRV